MFYMNLDIETYYDADYTLKKMTTSEYIYDPRFETIGMGVTTPNMRVWMEGAQFSEFARRADWSQVALTAHHAHFDGLILSHHYGVKPAFWFDTLSMGRGLHGDRGNSLEMLAEKYGVGVKGTEVIDAKGKHRADFTPEEWARYGEYCLNDCDLTERLRRVMVPQYVPNELRLIDLTVKMFTDPVFVLNEPKMRDFLAGEQRRKRELIARIADTPCKACGGAGCDYCHRTGKDIAEWKKIIGSGPKFAKLLRSLGVDPEMKPSPTAENPDGTPKLTFAFAKTDPFMKGLLESPNEDTRLAAEARVEVKSTTNESRTARMLNLGEGGRPLAVYLSYAKAHTFRWAGGDKTNFQNLGRGGVIRDAIEAPEGHEVVVADSSQIEARVTAGLAGQDDLIEAFRQGRDVYSEFATEAYGRPINRKRKEIVEGVEVYPDFIPGFVGKTCILGLGFGMGDLKFAATMQQGAMGGPPVTFGRELITQLGINPQKFLGNSRKVQRVAEMPSRLEMSDRLVHCMVAGEFVRRYRNRNDKIPVLWKYLDNVILPAMIAGVEIQFGPHGVLRTEKEAIVLPNGMRLRYPGLQRDDSGFSYWDGKKRIGIWGGALTENIVQALARIVVADQMVEIAKTWRIGTMTHDEVVAVAREAQAHQCLAEMLEAMKQPPKWWPELPVAAEGGTHKTYGGAK